MLLKSWRKQIFRPECNHSFESLHCLATLDQAVGAALPYLNRALGASQYIKDPPSATFRVHGRLITVHDDHIAINALKDEAQADQILNWLQREINEAWDNREQLDPSHQAAPQPKLIECLKLLPKTNCKKCGQPTCMVFATLLVQGAMGPEDCPGLSPDAAEALSGYLSGFELEVY